MKHPPDCNHCKAVRGDNHPFRRNGHPSKGEKHSIDCNHCKKIHNDDFDRGWGKCTKVIICSNCNREINARGFQNHYKNCLQTFWKKCDYVGCIKLIKCPKKFCSFSCHAKSRTGEKNSNWRGGGRKPRGEDWDEARAICYRRDGWRCQDCGITGIPLAVHHMIPWRIVQHNQQWNLITLCHTCHIKWDNNFRSKNEMIPYWFILKGGE